MTLPLCVIGGGLIGKRHAEQARLARGVELVAVVESDETRRATLEVDGLPMLARVEDLPDGVQAAIIATPTPSHAEITRVCLERGMACLVEKPITAQPSEADALVALARKLDLPLLTGHHRRCHPFVAEARKRLRDIGELVAVQGTWAVRKHDSYYDPDWRRGPGSGPIMTNLSHEIDLLRFLAGEITEVRAITSNAARGYEIEDTAALALHFASGALGTFLITDAGASPWSFEAATGENPDLPKLGEDAIRFIGTKGALCFPSLDLWRDAGEGEVEWRRPLECLPGPRMKAIDPIRVQIERFARVVEGAPDDTLATASDGRATLATTLAARIAAEQNRPVFPQEEFPA